MQDIEIARKATLQPITQIAQKLGVPEEELETYGKYKAKIPISYSSRKNNHSNRFSRWITKNREKGSASFKGAIFRTCIWH